MHQFGGTQSRRPIVSPIPSRVGSSGIPVGNSNLLPLLPRITTLRSTLLPCQTRRKSSRPLKRWVGFWVGKFAPSGLAGCRLTMQQALNQQLRQSQPEIPDQQIGNPAHLTLKISEKLATIRYRRDSPRAMGDGNLLSSPDHPSPKRRYARYQSPGRHEYTWPLARGGTT
jgi:hypothetical protein